MVDRILDILATDGRASSQGIAERLGLQADEVERAIRKLADERLILGYRAVVDWSRSDNERVFAFILVEANPEHGVGFDRVAETIALFDEVHSIHLTSGTADLTVVVEGTDFRELAQFVAEKLAPIPGVTATATSFVLKTYKLEGIMFGDGHGVRRLAVSP